MSLYLSLSHCALRICNCNNIKSGFIKHWRPIYTHNHKWIKNFNKCPTGDKWFGNFLTIWNVAKLQSCLCKFNLELNLIVYFGSLYFLDMLKMVFLKLSMANFGLWIISETWQPCHKSLSPHSILTLPHFFTIFCFTLFNVSKSRKFSFNKKILFRKKLVNFVCFFIPL